MPCWRARRSAAASQPARDALFEVIMSRFDVLAAYKPALKSIAAAWPVEAPVVRALCQSQAWMLRAAGIRSEGLEGQLRAAGLGTVYASVYRTWLSDDDPGLAKTMAALDRRLRRGERTLQSIDETVSKFCGFAKSCCEAAARNRTKPADADPNTPPTRRHRPPARCLDHLQLSSSDLFRGSSSQFARMALDKGARSTDLGASGSMGPRHKAEDDSEMEGYSGTEMMARRPPIELSPNVMSPPWLLAMSRAMARPRPVLPSS